VEFVVGMAYSSKLQPLVIDFIIHETRTFVQVRNLDERCVALGIDGLDACIMFVMVWEALREKVVSGLWFDKLARNVSANKPVCASSRRGRFETGSEYVE
jgi:hypothetical protein